MNITDKSETKNKIFQVGAELFSREGYHNVSVRQICEAAEVTKPVLYYYFKDKENLLLELVRDTHNVIEELKEKYIKPGSSFTDILKAVAEIYTAFLEQYPHFIKFSAFIQFMYVPESVKEYRTQIANEGFAELIQVFKNAQNEGLISSGEDPEMMMQSFIGPIIFIITKVIFNNQDISVFKQNVNEFVDFWINKFVIKTVNGEPNAKEI